MMVSKTPSRSDKGTKKVTETPAPHTQPAAVDTERRDRPNRLSQVAAWVGIVAGVVFVVAVIFFSGVYATTQFGGGDEYGANDHHGEWSEGTDNHHGEEAPEQGGR
jgi:hypothetical protein